MAIVAPAEHTSHAVKGMTAQWVTGGHKGSRMGHTTERQGGKPRTAAGVLWPLKTARTQPDASRVMVLRSLITFAQPHYQVSVSL